MILIIFCEPLFVSFVQCTQLPHQPSPSRGTQMLPWCTASNWRGLRVGWPQIPAIQVLFHESGVFVTCWKYNFEPENCVQRYNSVTSVGVEETSNTSVWRASRGPLNVHAVCSLPFPTPPVCLLSSPVCLVVLFSHPSVPFLLLHPFLHPPYMYAIFCLRCSIPWSRFTFSFSQMLFLLICPLTCTQGISSPDNNNPCSFSFPLMISICLVFLSCFLWWQVFLCS